MACTARLSVRSVRVTNGSRPKTSVTWVNADPTESPTFRSP